MSSSSEHHEEAERLLALAHAEKDGTSRSTILAEAQVHATLALAAGATAPGTTSAGSQGPAESPFGDATPIPSRPAEAPPRPGRPGPKRRINPGGNTLLPP